jgi:hypothetical protein
VTLSIEYQPLHDILSADVNPKLHSLPELRASYERFGFADAIIVDERTDKLVSGHGRVEALLAMFEAGEEPPEGITLMGGDADWLVPVQRGWASKSDREARAFLIAANRLTEIGRWDDQALAAVLAQLQQEATAGLLGTGYTQHELEMLLKSTNPIAPSEFPLQDPKALHTEYECPMCGYSWSGKPRSS